MSTALDTAPLKRDESARLRACEWEIENGLATFVRVGNALVAIREGRLYRATHATFEAYCAERWNLRRQRAYELIDASIVAGRLSEISDITPERESHVAPLTSLPPEEQQAVWQETVDSAPRGPDGKAHVTAEHVKKTVERRKQAAAAANSPKKPPPTFDAPSAIPATATPDQTTQDAVMLVVQALRSDVPDQAREAASAALRVLERRRMGTSVAAWKRCLRELQDAIIRDETPAKMAKCVELILRAIAEADA